MNSITKKKLTVMLDAEVYKALRENIGERKMGEFLSNLARPYVVKRSLDVGYRAMSLDTIHENDAKEWIESNLEDSEADNVWRF